MFETTKKDQFFKGEQPVVQMRPKGATLAPLVRDNPLLCVFWRILTKVSL